MRNIATFSPAAGTAARKAEHERTHRQLIDERRREADPAERVAREALLARAAARRAEAEEAALADPDRPGTRVLRRLESWICRTYRRAWRILDVAGVVLARRLGFLSPLRAPSVLLPDQDLSRSVNTRLRALRDCLRERGEAAMRAMLPCPDWFQVAHHLLRNATGGRRVSRHMAWP